MLRAAAMLQPAHQGRVPAGHLQAVDAEIEAVLLVALRIGALRHDQRPGVSAARARPASRSGSAACRGRCPRRSARSPGRAPIRRCAASSPSRCAASAACRAPRASRRAARAGAGKPASRRPGATVRSRSMPQATLSTVPNRLTSTGMPNGVPSGPVTFSNSTAGPFSASRRVWISSSRARATPAP